MSVWCDTEEEAREFVLAARDNGFIAYDNCIGSLRAFVYYGGRIKYAETRGWLINKGYVKHEIAFSDVFLVPKIDFSEEEFLNMLSQ